MRYCFSLAFVALMASLSSGALAQAVGAPASTSEIVVTGSREQIRDEIADLLTSSGGQLARFEDPLCLLIAGFDAEYTGHLRELILANAVSMGVDAGKPGCTPNAIVIFIDRPRALVEAMRERMHWAFGDLSLPARDRITKPLRTSYAWHANYVTGADGRAVESAGEVLGSGELGSGFSEIPTIRAFSASRLYTPAIRVMGGAYLVLDINKTPGMTLDQIADFATLNLVLDLEHDATERARADSILRLFDAASPSDAPARMSSFDRALASALYTPDNLSLPARRMEKQLASIIKRGKERDD